MKTRSDVSSNKTKKTNYWKFAFLILLGVVLGSTVFLGNRIFANREPELPEIPALTERQGDPVLTINSNKEKVNQIISFFLSEYQKDSDIEYKFYLENEALLNGTFEVLGFPIDFYLYFDPYVMENGNVQLKARSLSIGTLSLPIKDVMNMIKRNYKLPDWIEVNTDDLTIMLRLDQFRMQNGMYIKADKIDLVNDDIRFSLYLPKDTSDASNNSNTNKTSTSSTESKTKENKKSSDE
ncbi:YpmS family protein [Enterococcus faecium]|uniref:YpmS family protein n=1 Tax=Enterococcus faecium TaxID=1352 RepID=UPI00145C1C45|nr:YpmS family protein [Enterococcus faecium]MCM6896159.1 YpmS family protein [Enterococcus faecium]MCM6908086.1 YpmS family protein [Enterococcus faecium]MCM6926710.1 YpmS family protein [Enterococcus faecium]MCM6936287.1 YpmS family protein [Enterococcus faecium]NMP65981.1 YpmS family protein [Enterococcus faecium]